MTATDKAKDPYMADEVMRQLWMEEITMDEFQEYIKFTNEEIPIDSVPALYCPGTIE